MTEAVVKKKVIKLPFEEDAPIREGMLVEHIKDGYVNRGIVVSVFHKLKGSVRYVVENPAGLLFIFDNEFLRRVK